MLCSQNKIQNLLMYLAQLETVTCICEIHLKSNLKLKIMSAELMKQIVSDLNRISLLYILLISYPVYCLANRLIDSERI